MHARMALLRLSKGTCGRCLFDGRVGGGMVDLVDLVSVTTRPVRHQDIMDYNGVSMRFIGYLIRKGRRANRCDRNYWWSSI